ncbi:hypothetical protein DH2020_015910 [Rehmannia glutinosa]|uniref:Uncharacterized protein n=1 Tax=Rehmannia glutinosa TaxID=99300 RepID=A0ABR0WVM2_REHGL
MVPIEHVKRNSEIGADGLTLLVSITRACLNATASLTNDCVQAIHQLENKRSNLCKMLLLKLACSVELFFSYAALAFALEGPGESRESNPVLYRTLHLSIQCIQSVLTDSNIQNAINREAAAIAGECLKILMLLQTLAKGSDYQKGLIHLLLETILMIFSTSEGSLSQEANDLRDIAIKLVSQLAQIPSSAVFIKDILLSMPAMQRQQLQDIIRASVTQDKNPKPMPSSGPPLLIKLPTQTDQNAEKHSIPLDPPKESNDSSGVEEEEEDDWDTFQSFPASGNETAPDPEKPSSISDYNNRNSEYEGYSASPSLSNKESPSIEDHELTEAVRANQMEECRGPEDSWSSSQQPDELVSGIADDQLLPKIQLDQVEEEQTEPFANYLEKTETVPSNENIRRSDVVHVDSAEISESPSDEHHTETYHDYEKGSPEIPYVEPSVEHYHESASIPDSKVILKDEQGGPVVSTDNSEVTSITDDSSNMSRLSDTLDDLENEKKLPGN